MEVLAKTPHQPTSQEGRRAERHILSLQSTHMLIDRQARSIVVSDLSSLGFSFESGQNELVGTKLDIALPEVGEVTAVVAWSDQKRHGCHFEFPLSAAQLAAARLKASPLVNVEATPPLSPDADPQIDPLLRSTRGFIWIAGAILPWLAIGLLTFFV